MKTLHPQLKKTYKYYEGGHKFSHTNAKCHYCRRIEDKKGIKYFIYCWVYDIQGVDHFEFESQFEVNERSINIETVSWTNDPQEQRRPYPKLKEIEAMFEKMRKCYGKGYYEKF